MSRLFNRIKYIYQNEGFASLIKKVAKFLLSLSFEYQRFYLFERHVGEKINQAEYMPKIKTFAYCTIETAQQLNDLIDDGLDMSLMDIDEARWRLSKGAVAFLIFVGNELACRAWVGMTEEAKNTFNHYPYKVDFLGGEICGGDSWTNPKYRRQGLNIYMSYEGENFLREQGVKNTKSIVSIANIPSQGTATKFGGKIYAKACYLRIFGLKFWKETPYLEKTI